MKKYKKFLLIIYLFIILFMNSQVFSQESDYESSWQILVKEAEIAGYRSINYWQINEFKKFVQYGLVVAPFLEKVYNNSHNPKEELLALHLIGEITQDANKVWEVFNQNKPAMNSFNYTENFILLYLRNYNNKQFLQYVREKLYSKNLSHQALQSICWRGSIKASDIETFYSKTKDVYALLAIGSLNDKESRKILTRYIHSKNREELVYATLGMATLRDKKELNKVYFDFYLKYNTMGIEDSLSIHYIAAVIEGVQTKMIISQLVADIEKEPYTLPILEKISKRIYQLQLDFKTTGYAMDLFSNDNDIRKKEIREIQRWWQENKVNWKDSNKRIVLGVDFPYLGDIPDDIYFIIPGL